MIRVITVIRVVIFGLIGLLGSLGSLELLEGHSIVGSPQIKQPSIGTSNTITTYNYLPLLLLTTNTSTGSRTSSTSTSTTARTTTSTTTSTTTNATTSITFSVVQAVRNGANTHQPSVIDSMGVRMCACNTGNLF